MESWMVPGHMIWQEARQWPNCSGDTVSWGTSVPAGLERERETVPVGMGGGGVPMQQTRKLEERAALLGSLVGQDGTLLTQYKGSVNYKPLVDLKKEVN